MHKSKFYCKLKDILWMAKDFKNNPQTKKNNFFLYLEINKIKFLCGNRVKV